MAPCVTHARLPYHAEAVIQRNGYAKPVVPAQVHSSADEQAVVHDVVVRQRGAFGRACRARVN